MAVEFGPINTSKLYASDLVARSASPEGFAKAIQTLERVTPEVVNVLFFPANERPQATVPKTIAWSNPDKEFVLFQREGPSKQASKRNVRRLTRDPGTSSIKVSFESSDTGSGFEIFRSELLPTLTEEQFLPINGLVSDSEETHQYGIFYENGTMGLVLSPKLSEETRGGLRDWFRELPNQQ